MIFPLNMMVVKTTVMLIFILVGVAFYTLLERKILSYSHIRMGPNKVGVWGMFQPFSDAIKLFPKELMKLEMTNLILMVSAPLLGILVSTFLWVFFSYWGNISSLKNGLVFFFIISSISIYFLLYGGWSGSSNYSIIGSYRSSSQALSYEVGFFMVILCIFMVAFSLNFSYIYTISVSWVLFSFPMLIYWLICILAETNRTPFDFTEGESELVSGFNTEYGGGIFSIIFISEYSSIILFSFMTTYMFIGCSNHFLALSVAVMYLFLWVRTSFPRMRYDKLMIISWKGLMVSIMVFFYLFSFMTI